MSSPDSSGCSLPQVSEARTQSVIFAILFSDSAHSSARRLSGIVAETGLRSNRALRNDRSIRAKGLTAKSADCRISSFNSPGLSGVSRNALRECAAFCATATIIGGGGKCARNGNKLERKNAMTQSGSLGDFAPWPSSRVRSTRHDVPRRSKAFRHVPTCSNACENEKRSHRIQG